MDSINKKIEDIDEKMWEKMGGLDKRFTEF